MGEAEATLPKGCIGNFVLRATCAVLRILSKLNLSKEEIDYNLPYEKERNPNPTSTPKPQQTPIPRPTPKPIFPIIN
jgi:hypothetical protein